MNLHIQDKIIKNRLLKLAEELGHVSRACKIFGYSRDSFYLKNFMKKKVKKV